MIKELLINKYLSEVPMCNKKAIVVVDFVAYVRKVPLKKPNWKLKDIWQNICGTLSLNLQVIMQK